jgi:hypothetical protein
MARTRTTNIGADRIASNVTALDASGISLAATATLAIAASVATDTVVKAAPGRLARLIVTTLGTNALLIYDNATTGSGVIIGAIPASAAVGSSFLFDMPAANGITVKGSGTNPAVTISFS